MARKFKHGRMISHKKNRQITVGEPKRASYNKKRFFETHCDKHGIKKGKDIHFSVSVGEPLTKEERFAGCPFCNAENKS